MDRQNSTTFMTASASGMPYVIGKTKKSLVCLFAAQEQSDRLHALTNVVFSSAFVAPAIVTLRLFD
jgi:hypothetical protein